MDKINQVLGQGDYVNTRLYLYLELTQLSLLNLSANDDAYIIFRILDDFNEHDLSNNIVTRYIRIASKNGGIISPGDGFFDVVNSDKSKVNQEINSSELIQSNEPLVYPNPASNDLNNNLILTKEEKNNRNFHFNISTLENGIYILKMISNSGQEFQQKIMIK